MYPHHYRLPGSRREYVSPEYRAWKNMKARCSNPTYPDFHRYGGRGITVCERWREDFYNFLADMGLRPEGLSLDRWPDNNGNYEPGNCRWASDRDQRRNTRRNVHLTISGRTQTMADWAQESGLHKNTLQKRVSRGWPADRLLERP